MSTESTIVGLVRGPTHHILERDGRARFVCCAVDLLLNAAGLPAAGRTLCPVCGQSIQVRTGGGRLEAVSPSEAVVFAQEAVGGAGRREICCEESAMFDSARCATLWVQARGHAVRRIRPVVDYAERCCAPEFRHPTVTKPV